MSDDAKIKTHNERIGKAFKGLKDAKAKASRHQSELAEISSQNTARHCKLTETLLKASKKVVTAQTKYEKEVANGQALGPIGSGKVKLISQLEEL